MKIEAFLKKLCSFLDLEEQDVEVKVIEDDEKMKIQLFLNQDDASLVIGNKGDTLEAIEYLIKVIFKEEYQDKKITFDINDYKQQKTEKLLERVREISSSILETGQAYTFDYLNSYERFVIHSEISENPDFKDLESFSEDGELGRFLTIQLKSK